MPIPLQQLLAQNPPTTSGIHEAVAQHSETIFEEFRGILPLFLGKRQLGPFINVALPNAITQSSETLLQTLGDFILVYQLRLVSFVTAMRMRYSEDDEPRLSALLITADRAKAYFQLPWKLEFDSQNDIQSASRTQAPDPIIPSEIWSQLFQQGDEAEEKQVAYQRLVERFGSAEQLPKP